jgi:hypothetical protein
MTSSTYYDTIPAGYVEILTFNESGSHEIEVLSEGMMIYSAELDIE